MTLVAIGTLRVKILNLIPESILFSQANIFVECLYLITELNFKVAPNYRWVRKSMRSLKCGALEQYEI